MNKDEEKRHALKHRAKYYYHCVFGVREDVWEGANLDMYRFKTNNVFETEAAAWADYKRIMPY